MGFLKERKSMSPIISVVLLVGISVAACALAYGWYIGIQKGAGQATGGTAARTAQSTAAAILITNVGANNGINVTVANIGAVSVTGLTLYVDNSVVPSSGQHYVNKDSVISLSNSSTNYTMPSGVHTVKVGSYQGAEASQVVVK
ncbi:hypothetical protein BMS3Bbin15_00728 [archaeon BMS3Bbin15]|nr:hypothetical protein BMS3Bbin15_00728 [archaeon BMS3Bbin15]